MEKVWRDVTMDCNLQLGGMFPYEGNGHYIALGHGGIWILAFGLNKVNINPDIARLGYKIEYTRTDLTLGWFKVLKAEEE